MRLWLLRHARVLAAPGLCYGASDLPADPEATQVAAGHAAAALPAGLPVWVSGLHRARALADALQALRPDLGTPRCDERLNEMDFGRWEGRAWADIPRTEVDAWTEHFADHRVGGGESTRQVLERVADALAALRTEVGPQGQVLWVTHAGVIRAITHLARHGGTSIERARDWPVQAPACGEWTVTDLPP